MSVLPQLERELRAAHARRRAARSWRRAFGGDRIALAAAVAVAIGVAVVGVVAIRHRPASHPGVPGGHGMGARTLLRGLAGPSVYATSAGLFVTEGTHAAESRLLRIDPASGAITCDITFAGVIDDLKVAAGAVWVTTTSGTRHSLWRLDSHSLVKLSPVIGMGSSPASAGRTGSIAVAGGWLWVGGADSIERVSLRTGHVTGGVPVADAHGVELAADRGGRVLLDSVRTKAAAVTRVERRDPRTGATVTITLAGRDRPRFAGIIDGSAWAKVNASTGGFVTTLNPRSLRLTARLRGLSDVNVVLAPHAVLVTHAFGGTNYCLAPAGGIVRGTFTLPRGARLRAADGDAIYYVTRLGGPVRADLVRAPLDPRCR